MRKTIALTMIVKDEYHNLPKLFKGLHGCFDKAYITDTGSSDDTVHYLLGEEARNDLGCEIEIFHFNWVRDFAKARNHNLYAIKEDYWMWLDGDDGLKNKDNFLAWRDEAMSLCDIWYLPYNYSLNPDGSPLVSFIRERVFRTKYGFKFKDFIHEGVDPREIDQKIMGNVVQSFSIDHLRTTEEAIADKGRNLSILEENKDNLSERLKFYYGKELFDAGKFKEASEVLKNIVKSSTMEMGDRVLGMQYLIHSLNMIGSLTEAIEYGILAINLDPNRAEYYCLIGDSYLKLQAPDKAMPFFAAAKSCINGSKSGTKHEFSFNDCYSTIPSINIAQILFFRGDFEGCIKELQTLSELPPEAIGLLDEAKKAILATTLSQEAQDCDDIVITCPYPGAYPWDEEKYRTKGLGGSETAAVEMSMHLKRITGRPVIIFQHRADTYVSPSGVSYRPAQELHDYFHKWKPTLHIAWRHSARFTSAKSVVWSHDLQTPGIENFQNYDKIFALSEFHKNFMRGTQGVPEDKIIVTRNGIEPKRFDDVGNIKKIPNKVIWPNSPDRGLEYAIQVIDLVRQEIPDVELNIFYGFDNMKKYGMAQQAEELEKMIESRPWIKYRGNVDQATLAKEFMESEVWLYTANFVETFAITAIEALCSKAWPVVRKFGALKSTLEKAEHLRMADVLDIDMDSEAIPLFAEKVIEALIEKKWEYIAVNPETFSWESVAKEWINTFEL